MHQGECLRIEAIVDPPPLLSIRDDASILQHLEVERKPGLARAQLIREITDTLFALAESLNQSQASSVAKGPE
jgi:hypothetical protein